MSVRTVECMWKEKNKKEGGGREERKKRWAHQ